MSVQHTPAPARSDLPLASVDRPAAPAAPYRQHGTALTAGALAWAASILAVGFRYDEGAEASIFALGSGLFQVGLLFLIVALYRSRALGTGRVASTFIRIEAVLVSLALCSTIADGLHLSDMDVLGWALLDSFWPISMLGMFGIGIRVAVAGRWRGPARYWPMVAESWAVVTIPTIGVFGPGVALWVGAAHLVVGYAVLGQLLARKRD